MPERSRLEKLQFCVLYSRFLLRVVDLEALSVQADVPKMLGQIASILIMFSLLNGMEPLFPGLGRMPPAALRAAASILVHRMIATTMLVVGLFAVLSWDSTFPDKRDVMVFGPLPVRARTLFLAKTGAAGTALGLAVLSLNFATGIIWPVVLSSGGLAGMARFFAASWITIVTAGGFLYGSVLTVQGMTALLPRRYFLRLSAFLQIAAFCLFLGVYFLQPALAAPDALAAAAHQRVLCWLPSYWFLGLFHVLNGFAPPAFLPLAVRASAGAAVAVAGAATVLLWSYFRTVRRIAEEPDIVPGARSGHGMPRFAPSLRGAITLFSLRSSLRSRQHRVILAFYLGIGFAIALSCLGIPAARSAPGAGVHPLSLRFVISTIVMMSFAVVGMRSVFSLPVTLAANWVFRVTEIREPQEYIAAVRWSLLAMAVVPVLLASVALALPFEPLRQVAAHTAVLGLLGGIFAEIALLGFHKIPFTCSYLPGRTNVSFAFWAYVVVLIPLTVRYAHLEQQAMAKPLGYAALVAGLGLVLLGLRWRTRWLAGSEPLRFGEAPAAEILALGLQKD
jgi:hypothetical protein